MLVLAWRRRDTPEGAFTIAVCGSASLYVLTFFAVGVASDFRYGYWAVLASLAGLPALLVRVRPQPG
jgi:peptidoglycan/LPS O-acetylase OafA/YrhL